MLENKLRKESRLKPLLNKSIEKTSIKDLSIDSQTKHKTKDKLKLNGKCVK